MEALYCCLKNGQFLVLFLLVSACGAKVSAQTTSSDTVPTVTIWAADPIASQSGDPGAFTVARQDNTNLALNVYYQIGGTASNGVDYAQIGNWVVIPAGAISSSVTITPINPSQTDVQTVVLQLAPSPLMSPMIPVNYAIGSPSNATVYIKGQGVTNLPPLVNIIEPTDGETFVAPANIFIEAPAGDLDGYVTTVEFFAGTNSLGVFTNPPPPPGSPVPAVVIIPQLFWTNAPVGNYTLTAVATDNDGASSISAPVNVTVQPRPLPSVSIIEPKDGDTFYTPPTTNIFISAFAIDPDKPVASVEFFAGTNSLGFGYPMVIPAYVCSNCPPFPNFGLIWTNPPVGDFALTAVATGYDGAFSSSTSAPVNITVLQGPLPNQPPTVSIFVPTNGTVYYTPTNIETNINFEATIEMLAKASDPDGTVTNVEFFAGTNDLGAGAPVVLDPPGVNGVTGLVYFIYWQNPSPGNYALTAVATDDGGESTTSTAVNVTIQPSPPPPINPPPSVRIISPPNGAVFRAPINLPLFAFFTYPHGPGDWAGVGFYDGTNFLGTAHPISKPTPLPLTPGGPTPGPIPVPPTALSTNIYELVWTNASVGNHILTAEAEGGSFLNAAIWRIVSAPVDITILPPLPPPTNRPAVVNIVATDPVAIEGTNIWVWAGETNSTPTWAAWPPVIRRFFTNCAPKTATFTVRRFGNTNDDLTVPYDIGGTASNGVDYVTLPGSVTIPAAEHSAMITIVPIDNGPTNVNKTVVLTLASSTNTPPDYFLGFPRRAAAVIIGSNGPRPLTGMLSDGSFHFVAPGPDAAWFCIEYSTNLTDWTPVCTNQVINGSIDFVDPDAHGNPSRFYRAVPLANGPSD